MKLYNIRPYIRRDGVLQQPKIIIVANMVYEDSLEWAMLWLESLEGRSGFEGPGKFSGCRNAAKTFPDMGTAKQAVDNLVYRDDHLVMDYKNSYTSGNPKMDETTLRDYFAGEALSALITAPESPTSAARLAYQYAEAMLNERAK